MKQVSATIAVVLAVLATYVVALQCPQATDSDCNFTTLRCCDNNFQKALKLTNCSGSFFDEPQCHQQQLETMYTSGITGLFQVCSAFTDYYQCLGASAATCTSVQYHMKNGMNAQDAVTLISIYRQFGFACGAGLDTFANTDTCMSGIFANQTTQINNCRNTFSNNLQGAGKQDDAEKCKYFSEYTGCFQNVFKTCGLESSWWGCEYARQSTKEFLHNCFEQCSVENTLLLAANTVQYHKIVKN